MRLSSLQQYGIVTTNYWAFTLTDGALRMLVIFHFHSLGYTTLEIASYFMSSLASSLISMVDGLEQDMDYV